MKERIINYLRAGYSGIYIVSSEETRVEAEIKGVCDTVQYGLHVWSVTEGLVSLSDQQVQNAQDPLEAIEACDELPENSLVLLKDFHSFIEDGNPVLIRKLKEALRAGKARGRVLVILGCRLALPPELEREFVVLDFVLPDREALGIILDNIARAGEQPDAEGTERELLLDAATGLTSIEAENAYALSLVESGRLNHEVVAREKAHEVGKNGLLEIISNVRSLNDVGGLDLLKEWLIARQDAFGKEAREYGLPAPKGLLIVGIPGTGKSLTAKATASVLQRPLLRLDTGRLFGGLVGQSEGNLRSVIATVEAIAPCVLWIDEIEKGFGGNSGGQMDGGTSTRVFGTFLSWMQERAAPVFIVATANDVTKLPAEFLRKGRFDELFFVDLPSEVERGSVWRIQIEKYGRKPADYDIIQLARAADGWTGAEIEQLFIESLYTAFAKRREPTDLDIMMGSEDLVPLSKLMADDIKALRRWSQGRARSASSTEEKNSTRRIKTK